MLRTKSRERVCVEGLGFAAGSLELGLHKDKLASAVVPENDVNPKVTATPVHGVVKVTTQPLVPTHK